MDLVAPRDITPTVGVSGIANPVRVGDTVRKTNPTLTLDWTAGADGSGISQYLVGINTNPDADPNALTTVAGGGSRHIQFMPTEATTYYAHVIARDPYGNENVQNFGPFYLDARTTPDLIAPLNYDDWTQSGATLISSDNALHAVNTKQTPQQFYASWKQNALRLAWTGANWNGDGDLFVYLDTGAGGATSLYNPFPLGTDGQQSGREENATSVPVQLPAGFNAAYVVWLHDANTATLLHWNGSGWTSVQTLGASQYKLDLTVSPPRSDVYLPFNSLGLTPASTLKVLATATDENTFAIWAAAPDKNPLNSDRVFSVPPARTIGAFQLTQFWDFGTLGDGVVPNKNKTAGADLVGRLDSSTESITVGFLGDAMFDLLKPNTRLDANNDGVPDVTLPISKKVGPLGNGATITYTLRYENRGTVTAKNVTLTAHAYGALRLAGNQATQTFNLGDVSAGISSTLQIHATVNSALNSKSAELDATLGRFARRIRLVLGTKSGGH